LHRSRLERFWMVSSAELAVPRVMMKQRRHERLILAWVVRGGAMDVTRHVLWWYAYVGETLGRRKKVGHSAGMRALVDVISASV
jgi:hypothetical protein